MISEGKHWKASIEKIFVKQAFSIIRKDTTFFLAIKSLWKGVLTY